MQGVSQVKMIASRDRARVNSLNAAGDLFKLTKEILMVFKDGNKSRFTRVGGGANAGGVARVSDIRR